MFDVFREKDAYGDDVHWVGLTLSYDELQTLGKILW